MAEGTSHGTARPCDPDNASYARELDRAHNLSRFSRRDRNRSRSLQGRVTAAPPMPEALDFMPGWVTSRHEGCVSTMLADKRLEYCTAGAPLQGSGATKWGMQAEKHGISGAFGLDIALV